MRHHTKMAAGCLRWAFNSKDWNPSKLDWMSAAQCIQQEEQERIGKFVFKRDAKASIIGRLMMRKAIHEITSLPYTDIQLGRTNKGKPFLRNSLPLELQNFSFNVSHQGELVVLATEKDCPVGIDVMDLEANRSTSVEKFFHTMRKQFTEDEWKLIKHSSDERRQLQTFYRLWCLKESYVKALGIGIGFAVQRLNFDLVTPTLPQAELVQDTKLSVDGLPVLSWKFEECLLGNHTVAVAVDCSKTQNSKNNDSFHVPKFVTLTFAELMEDIKPLRDKDQQYAEAFISKPEDPTVLRQNCGKS